MNHLVWRMTTSTWQRLTDLYAQLEYTPPDSDEALFLREEIKRLPGFPIHADEWSDMIHFEVIDHIQS